MSVSWPAAFYHITNQTQKCLLLFKIRSHCGYPLTSSTLRASPAPKEEKETGTQDLYPRAAISRGECGLCMSSSETGHTTTTAGIFSRSAKTRHGASELSWTPRWPRLPGRAGSAQPCSHPRAGSSGPARPRSADGLNGWGRPEVCYLDTFIKEAGD